MHILAILRDLGKSPISRDLFIKLDSIGARTLMVDLRIVVRIISQPTLLLCSRLIIILIITGIDDGWKFCYYFQKKSEEDYDNTAL